MPDLRRTRRNIQIALIAMAAVDIVAIGVLFSPLVGSSASRRAELDQLWQDLQQKTRQVEPLRGMDKKVTIAGQEIAEFYKDRLPSQESVISDQLGKIAAENGVKILSARYKTEDSEEVNLRPITIEADLAGDYLQLVRFLNAVERDKNFFIVDSVALGGEQNGVKLAVKLETFLRTGV